MVSEVVGLLAVLTLIATPSFENYTIIGVDLSQRPEAVVIREENSGREDLFAVHEVAFGRFRVERVYRNGADLREVSSGVVSSVPMHGGRASTSRDFTTADFTGIGGGYDEVEFEKRDDNVTWVRYIDGLDIRGLPSTIYTNRGGESLFTNIAKIGIEATTEGSVPDEHPAGLSLHGVATGSLVDGLRLTDGDIITTINGAPVNSPGELMRELKSARMGVIEIGYRAKSLGYTPFTTGLLIR